MQYYYFCFFFKVVQLLKEAELVQLIGLHCHIGSTIRDARLYSEVTRVLLEIRLKVSVISSFFCCRHQGRVLIDTKKTFPVVG